MHVSVAIRAIYFRLAKYSFYRVDTSLQIKVGDFGLARDIYTDEYYRTSKEAKLPVRWMAPEALLDQISNEKTDVVSRI